MRARYGDDSMTCSQCKDKVRCYPQGECPLKGRCLWHGMPHHQDTCADIERFDDDTKVEEKVHL